MMSSTSSNWLDRLRSSRGFPTGDEPDLDRFLSSSTSSGSVPTTTESATHSESTRLRREKTTTECGPSSSSTEFTGVLCDLFNMGEPSRRFSKKSSRKQSNPRFFGVSSETELPSSSDDLRKSENGGLVSSGDNSNNNNNNNNTTHNNNNNNNNNNNHNNNVIDDNDNFVNDIEDDFDTKSYSRSEVTVIDTSCAEWKSDKWVFRKNDEWKIKDKKSKGKHKVGVVVVGGVKKRKLLDGSKKLDDDHMKKKNKKKEDDESLLFQQNKGQPQNDKIRESVQEKGDFLGKVPQKRFPCPRPPEKFRNEDSPVVLLKSIPSSNINAAIKPVKSFHKKRPKQMKIV